MTSPTVVCQARRPDGSICFASAVVRVVDPIYGTRMSWAAGGQFEQYLIETRYTIDCPGCGERVNVEPAK